MKNDIFGHSWEEIQAMQQGEHKPKTVDLSLDQWKADVLRDVERRFPVADAAVKGTGIALPDGYELDGEVWIFICP